MYKKPATFVILVFILLCSCASADNRQGSMVSLASQEFFNNIQRAILNNDKTWMAENTSYPITVCVNNIQKSISNREEFVSAYEAIINEKVKQAAKTQNANSLFRNWRGVMVGNGEIWFEEVYLIPDNTSSHKFYIIGINNCGE